jgi:beta-glucosidase/6-phospho-beta-glucosidase/beta-galactosidase
MFSLNTWANFEFPDDFMFGVSNAASQVEDGINDPWMEFAGKGKSKGFTNHANPKDKIRFWSDPDTELDLASELGVQVFRMSVSWHRLVPKKPVKPGVQNTQALEGYKQILSKIKSRGMKVMLTLYHHSMPQWAIDMGGWANPELIKHFVAMSNDVYAALGSQVDYWNTFNEPNVYAMFTYVAGIWPPGKASILNAIALGPLYKGDFYVALENMAKGHNEVYTSFKKKNVKVQIGIAHNTASYKQGSMLSYFSVLLSWKYMNHYFPDMVKNHLDFMGINYYGSEYMTMTGIHFDDRAEYNDAGRAIDPKGLYMMIKTFYQRYQKPIFITENGTADEDDIIRPAYLIEHLVAVHKALSEKVPVMGYIYWTLTDNFEWSDGYCPKFGLVALDRKQFIREKRDSFELYQGIIAQKAVSNELREFAWQRVKQNMGKPRKMCRADDAQAGLDRPRMIPLKEIDWRIK